MFRPKRKQKTIIDHDIYLPEDRQKALEKSWAGPFRKTVLPMIQDVGQKRVLSSFGYALAA